MSYEVSGLGFGLCSSLAKSWQHRNDDFSAAPRDWLYTAFMSTALRDTKQPVLLGTTSEL